MKKKERESKGDTKIDTPKFIGVQKRRDRIGRHYFMVSFSHKNVQYEFGMYKDAKECAKAYDLFVIRKGLDRKTNFFKKKIV